MENSDALACIHASNQKEISAERFSPVGGVLSTVTLVDEAQSLLQGILPIGAEFANTAEPIAVAVADVSLR